MQKVPLLLLSTFLFSTAAVRSNAVSIVFSDKATFLALTGSTAATTIPTTAPNTSTGFTSGSLTFSLGPGASNFPITDWTTRLPGNELAISGPENFNVDISGLVFSFGFDFVEPENDPNVNATFAESTFQVTLKNGLTTVDSFVFSRPNDSAQFVGVATDFLSAFNRVEIREIVGGAENEFFGQFYTGRTPAVPETGATGSLLALALTAVGVVRLKMRRSAY
jgi:hypothetical protein